MRSVHPLIDGGCRLPRRESAEPAGGLEQFERGARQALGFASLEVSTGFIAWAFGRRGLLRLDHQQLLCQESDRDRRLTLDPRGRRPTALPIVEKPRVWHSQTVLTE